MSNSKALLPSTPISLLGITRLIKAIINTGSINTITTQSNSDITCNIICNRINVTTFRLTFLANYTLNFGDAYADCLNVTLINLKANADCIEYAFSITQITLNINRASYSIHIANSNTRICTQSDSSAYSNSFNIAITQETLNISGAGLSIFSMALIVHRHFSQSSIANSKTIFITITIRFSIGFSSTIYSFESYGVSVGFDFDNSKAFNDGYFNSFEDGVAELQVGRESLCTGTSLYDSTPL